MSASVIKFNRRLKGSEKNRALSDGIQYEFEQLCGWPDCPAYPIAAHALNEEIKNCTAMHKIDFRKIYNGNLAF